VNKYLPLLLLLRMHPHQKTALAWMVKQELKEMHGMRGGILADVSLFFLVLIKLSNIFCLFFLMAGHGSGQNVNSDRFDSHQLPRGSAALKTRYRVCEAAHGGSARNQEGDAKAVGGRSVYPVRP
jgi:hypothetical protein